MARTQSPIPGPVHLNVRFREPFLPEAAAVEAAEKERKNGKAKWLFLPSASGPSKEQWEAVEKMFEAAKRPLILVGPSGFSASTLESLRKLSHHTGYPVLAENASGLPFRGGDRAFVSRQLEATLGAIREGALEAPDLLVRAGAPITGRALERLLASHPIPQILFDETGEGREPHLYPSICVQGGLKGWISAFLRSSLSLRDEAWRDSLLAFGKKREERLKDHLKEGELTEWHFHHELGAKLGEGSVVFLGNSMPVRDFNDVFAAEKLLHVFTNRGLSGIDGLLASAAGVALGSGRETHALIGDLSTLHDLSSLSILSSLREEISLTLWVLNNGGGEIFRIVPTAKTAGEAEWFTTPQEYDLASLAKAFHLPFARLSTLAALQELDPSACSGNGVRVIEILANRETNLATRHGFGEK